VTTDDEDEPVNPAPYADGLRTIESSTMQQYKSAIVWYYDEVNARLDPEINKYMNTFVKGYKEIIANKKTRGIMDVTEGNL
jgi:hypothetical protein